ncbi:MAG TPA: hypothetical protein VH482_05485 [Thermomicrobiales bacterium]
MHPIPESTADKTVYPITRGHTFSVYADHAAKNPGAVWLHHNSQAPNSYSCFLFIGKREVKAAIEALVAAYEAIP